MKYCFPLLAMLLSIAALAQDSTIYRTVGVIQGRYVDFQADNLGNYYLLDEQNQLKKLNARGDSMGVFNDVRRFGKLTYMDVSNPLKVLLYYRNFSTIVVLDRFMGVVNTLDLRKAGIFRVKAIARSYDNMIWVYDEQQNQLKKIDDDGNVRLSSVDFRTLFDEVPTPEKMVDQEGYVYLYDAEKGVYVFDIYGAFRTRLSYPQLNAFTVIGKTIVGIHEGKMLMYTTGTLQEKRFPLPEGVTGNEKIVVQPGKFYVLKNGSIFHYQF